MSETIEKINSIYSDLGDSIEWLNEAHNENDTDEIFCVALAMALELQELLKLTKQLKERI